MSRVPPEVMQQRKAFILANHMRLTATEIAKELDIFQSQVTQCCKLLGIECISEREKQIQFIKDHPEWSVAEIATALNKSEGGIRNLISQEKLRPGAGKVNPERMKAKLREMGVKYIPPEAPPSTLQESQKILDDYDKRIADIRAARASFTNYNQSHSPFGLADNLHGVKATGEVQRFYPEIVRL